MGFPSFDSTRTTFDALQNARREATNVKRYWTVTRPKFASANQSANAILDLMNNLKSSIEVWEAAAATPGIAEYTQAQLGGSNKDIIADFQAMVTAAKAVRDFIVGAFPKSGTFILKDTIEADGAITVRQFRPDDLAGLIAAMDTLAATID